MTDKGAGVARQEEENKTQRRLVKVGSTVEGKTGWDSETVRQMISYGGS